ncbi:hypothetical protein [Actinomadura opuntiae]|uniref:hypothetical protein n=1 Tax=Actinomadura sp. OS1-43 TaxID=604315 RepID=UPI00255AF16B|nr:hypothetical protein [Actinomadura sp. OS1-43]
MLLVGLLVMRRAGLLAELRADRSPGSASGRLPRCVRGCGFGHCGWARNGCVAQLAKAFSSWAPVAVVLVALVRVGAFLVEQIDRAAAGP